MPSLRWRKGISGASARERSVILDVEARIRQRALTDEYEFLCAKSGSILVDAHSLAIRSLVVEWARHERRLHLRVTVHYRPTGRLRVYTGRTALSTSR